ncbi:hypothetical protein [Bradyrhizobium arachidis]|uniref:Uncharacterized protein n=1 Tax=Bradyrhizobium arachidis TaxID=858423 RepID=A0AAE7THK8_9BRAD|nr:hypothetical protein [Bradyrhizobium arachidis]QOZ68590.1 hypothetical protein WN72_21390 [Bradyrhizobium arachidis]SFV06573.1 hypothetical protein SAMN05192541_112167 [Bradyrhizobium arachidis]
MHILNNPGRPAGRQHRRLVLAALAATALSLGQIQIAAADATISIDTASTLPQGGGNVLPTLKNIFQSGNAPGSVSGYPDTLTDQMLPLLAGIGTKRARLLLTDEYCDIDAQGNFGGNDAATPPTFSAGDCFPLAWQLDWLLKANLSPHMAVASHMPISFIQYGEPETWGDRRIDPNNANSPKIIDHYKDYAKALVRYIATRAFTGVAQTAVFEVSNEIDIAADYPVCNGSTCAPPDLGPWKRWLWWMNPATYSFSSTSQAYAITDEDNPQLGFPNNGDARRLGRNLLPVQKIFADAITAVNAELGQNSAYNGKTIEIAGPAMAGWNLIVRPQGTGPSLEEQFIEQVFNPSALPYGAKFNMPLNHFSFHYYGSVETLRTNTVEHACDDVTQPFALFEQMTNAYRAKLNAYNMQNVPLFLSEWGPSSCSNGDVNWSHKGAAWVAAFLPEALAQGVTMGSFLTVEDRLVYGGPAAPSALGTASLLHTYGSGTSYTFLPKPHTNVFKMYNLMTGLRNQVTVTPTSGSHLNAFVTSDQSSTNVMVYNFDPYLVFNNDANTRTGTAENFSISVSNIFKTVGYSGPVRVQRYQVDATTSNLKNFIDYANAHSGNTSGAPDPSLQLIEDYTATAVNGELQLHSSTAGSPAKPLGLGVALYRITLN